MATGRKTGGRVAGTPNKATADLPEKLAAIGCDPVEGLARIAGNPRTPVAVRARCFAELAQYVYPKRKALEHTGADGNALKIEVTRVGSRREGLMDG
jgi:hypothetical protein